MALELQAVDSVTAKGLRPYQEDRSFSLTATEGLCFGVFDGHGGNRCSEYLADNFSEAFMTVLESDLEDENIWEARLRETFKSLNLATQAYADGSTGSVVFLPWEGDRVYTAVLGDSPIILKQADQSIWVAPEHNVRTNSVEADAARARGGTVSRDGYLYDSYHGQGLQMARAFGDAELARVLSRVPDTSTRVLGTGSWVLVASDGALDPSHANEEEGIKALTEMINAGATAQGIVDRALATPTHDNVTALLVRVV